MDERTAIQFLVGPVTTLALTGIMLAVLHAKARSLGLSLFSNLGAVGWSVAVLIVFAAGLFSAALSGILITPYNVPLDWTPVFVWTPVLGGLGLVAFLFARRMLVRHGAEVRTPPAS